MSRYARLNDGKFEFAPAVIKVGGKTYRGGIPNCIYIEAGYYPIVTVDKPENTKEDGWEIVDETIRKKYVPYTPEEQEEINGIRIVLMNRDEAEAYDHMEETIQLAQDAALEAQQEAEAARAGVAAAVEAKEAAEAALADTADIVAKIEEVFG